MPDINIYSQDPTTSVWRKPGYKSMGYSDGDAVEHRLLTAIRQSLDVSSNSEELQQYMVDWPSEYHLSPVRHNLLRPFTIGPSDRILELGCGCGAITRYLGETGAAIVAVEGSYRRAEIAAERCRDLSNVSIYCDNLTNFESDEKFDCVTLIGVLEYAPLFIESDDPIRTCLTHALSFLKEEGVLILAIENKLGLKYFSGCREDHLGVPYFGINDLYTAGTPATFGKLEITRHLNRSGFAALDFFYPFPDYKLPSLILSKHGSQSEKLNLKDLLIYAVSRNFPEDHHRAFAEGLAWGPVTENRMLEEMANSFLIRAYKNAKSDSIKDWLAKTYSRSPRRPEFLVETTIEPNINGNLSVRKHPLVAAAYQKNIAHTSFRHVTTDSEYIHGQLLLRDIQLTIVREASLAEIATCFRPWLTYLYTHESPKKDGKRMLPGNFIDCIPANLIITDAGGIEFIDAEWISEHNIPMSWVLIRGVIHSLIGCLNSRILADMTYSQLIDIIIDHALDDSDYALAGAMEQQFSDYCHTGTGNKVSIINFAKEKISLLRRLSDAPVLRQTVSTCEQTIGTYESDLKRIKNTVSWQITKPLRLFAGLVRNPRAVLTELRRRCHIAPRATDYSALVPFAFPPAEWESAPSLAVICHIFYVDMVDEFAHYFSNIPFQFDLFITTDTQEKRTRLEKFFSRWKGKIEVRITPNRGRDIAPKLITYRDVYDHYEYILHIHTKKSPHHGRLSGWRFYLLETLLGSTEVVKSVFEAFRDSPELGMVAPQHFEAIYKSVGWGKNFEIVQLLADRMGIEISRNGPIDFPSGSMFWARSAAIKPLLKCNLSFDEFPAETGQLDQTLGHAIERLYFFSCEHAGYRWMKISRPNLLGNPASGKLIACREDLTNFICNFQPKLIK